MAAEGGDDALVVDVFEVHHDALGVVGHVGVLDGCAGDAVVVGDEVDDGDVMSQSGLHLHGAEAEGAVADYAYDGLVGAGELGAEGEGDTDAHAAVGAGVEAGGRLVGGDDLASCT